MNKIHQIFDFNKILRSKSNISYYQLNIDLQLIS